MLRTFAILAVIYCGSNTFSAPPSTFESFLRGVSFKDGLIADDAIANDAATNTIELPIGELQTSEIETLDPSALNPEPDDAAVSREADPELEGLKLEDPEIEDPELIDLGDRERDPNSPAALMLADVIASTLRSYPEISAARAQFRLSDGDLLSAYGQYDTKLKAYSLAEPLGFFEMYRNGLGLARQTWWGTQIEAGYKIGRGTFKPWFLERQTNDAGEFSLEVEKPLLQGRAIDADRVAVFQASLARASADPLITQAILETSLEAAMTYWEWVSAGAVLVAQSELRELAELRAEQLAIGVEAGKFAEIDTILNAQLLAERQRNEVESLRKLQTTAIKLSLYVRDAAGNPMIPPKLWLPEEFPRIVIPQIDADTLLVDAFRRRPEMSLLNLQRDSLTWDRRLANNQLLPTLNFVSKVSQDLGEPSTSSDNKQPLELLLGVTSEVPYQRRKARGKIRATDAKLFQVDQKARLTRDKIANEVTSAIAKLELNEQLVDVSITSYRNALESLDRFRFAFDRGKIDLLYLNLIETKAFEDLTKLIKSRAELLQSLATLQIAIGLDPMDAAVLLP